MSTRLLSPGLSLLVAAAATAGLVACTSTPTSPSTGATGTGTGTSSVSFKTQVAPLLTSTCVSCHSTGGSAQRDLNIADASGNVNYTAVAQRAGAMLREVRSGVMPQGGPRWTTDQVNAFSTWYAAGAPNN